MGHEVHSTPDNDEGNRTEDEQSRLQAIGDRHQAAELVFDGLVRTPDVLGYWRARAKVDGLWELTLMRRGITQQTSSPSLREAQTKLDGTLPFNQDELDRLAEQMQKHEVSRYPELADRWYSDLDTESDQAKLLQRWGDWVDDNFPPSPQQPTAEGSSLVSLLKGMSDEIVGVI